jgi:hypothetical protein
LNDKNFLFVVADADDDVHRLNLFYLNINQKIVNHEVVLIIHDDNVVSIHLMISN